MRRNVSLFGFDPAAMIIQPIDFTPLMVNPLNACELLDTALAFINVFEIVSLQRLRSAKRSIFLDLIHGQLKESVHLTSRDDLVENKSIVIHRPSDLVALPDHFFPDKRIPAKIPITIFELAFLKSEFFAAICDEFLSTFSTAGVGTHFGFDEELFEFHYYPPMFDMIGKTMMVLHPTMDDS